LEVCPKGAFAGGGISDCYSYPYPYSYPQYKPYIYTL